MHTTSSKMVARNLPLFRWRGGRFTHRKFLIGVSLLMLADALCYLLSLTLIQTSFMHKYVLGRTENFLGEENADRARRAITEAFKAAERK